jgi:hypothetical protein
MGKTRESQGRMEGTMLATMVRARAPPRRTNVATLLGESQEKLGIMTDRNDKNAFKRGGRLKMSLEFNQGRCLYKRR